MNESIRGAFYVFFICVGIGSTVHDILYLLINVHSISVSKYVIAIVFTVFCLLNRKLPKW